MNLSADAKIFAGFALALISVVAAALLVEVYRVDAKLAFSILVILVGLSCILTYLLVRRNLARARDVEEELRSAGKFLDSIVDEVPAMIFMKDAVHLRFVRFNKAGEELTGFNRSELLGKNDYDLFPKDEADFFTAKDREVLREKKLLDIPEEPIKTKHQGTRILHTRKIALLGEHGEPQYLLGVSEDITDRKRSEEALRKAQGDLEIRIENRTAELKRANEALQRSEGHYRLLFEGNPLPMWVYDFETLAFLAVNDAAIRQYGYSRSEFLSMTIKDIRPREDVPRLLENLSRIPREFEGATEWRHRKKDGTVIDVEITSHQIAFAGRTARLVLTQDITERKKGDEARARMSAIVESSDDAVMAKTLGGIITNWNPGAERLFGYSAAEAIGKPMLMLIPRNRVEEESDILSRIGRGERVSSFDTVRIRKDGKEVHVSAAVSPIRDVSGTIIGASTIARDISGRIALASENARLYEEAQRLNEELERRVEERTAQLEVANRELEAFSYSVSHDLRAPLRSIDGFSQAIHDEYAERVDAKGKEYLQRVRSAAQKMAQLIDDLLNLSRVTRAEMHIETVDLSAMARAITDELLRLEPGRNVELRIPPGITAKGDTRLLYVVMNNLLDNAWKYTGKQGHATIEFGVLKDGEKPAYFIRDDGAGFDMKYADKLFGAFQRLHRIVEFPGTGIGLATVQRIIHRHGGRVWAEGEVDKGATFYFTLG
jgi:PAS domain S-box-containing protein